MQIKIGLFICYWYLAYLKYHQGNCDRSDQIIFWFLAVSTIPDYVHIFQEKGIEILFRSNWNAEFINLTIGIFSSL